MVTVHARVLVAQLLLCWLIWTLAQLHDCPEPHRSLLSEYSEFYRANKHAPDAQYIVQHCWGRGCQGVGDRIRGTLFMLRVAMKYRKILIIDWKNPAPLTNFLVPNQIDWTLTGFQEGFLEEQNSSAFQELNATLFDGPGSDEAVAKFRATKKFVTTSVQPFETPAPLLVPLPSVIVQRRQVGSCYFHFLFKLHPRIVELGEAHLRRLYGPDPGSFIAWHWRLYDVDLSSEQPVHLSQMLLSLSCAEKLARSVDVDLTKKPVLLISDSNILRQLVFKGAFRKIITTNTTARHIDKGHHPLDAYINIFVDIYVMSRARCLLTSASGFSKLALWTGGKDIISCGVDRLSCMM